MPVFQAILWIGYGLAQNVASFCPYSSFILAHPGRLHMSLKKIRLELARDHEFPEGSHNHGYEFVAPLDEEGHLDPAGWKTRRSECRVTRFWGDEDHENGHLVRKPGGHWAFHYDIHGDPDDDEAGYRFSSHPFMPGEYVSIKDHDDDTLRTFRVIRVQDLS